MKTFVDCGGLETNSQVDWSLYKFTNIAWRSLVRRVWIRRELPLNFSKWCSLCLFIHNVTNWAAVSSSETAVSCCLVEVLHHEMCLPLFCAGWACTAISMQYELITDGIWAWEIQWIFCLTKVVSFAPSGIEELMLLHYILIADTKRNASSLCL